MSAKFRLKKLDEFYDRALNLPKLLLSDDDYKRFSGWDEDDKIEHEFRQVKLNRMADFQDLIFDIRGFIKVSYPENTEYFRWINNSDFQSRTTITDEFNVYQNNEWSKGRINLISLLTNIKFEEKQRKEMEDYLANPTKKTLFTIAITAFMIILLVSLWNAPDEIMLKVFGIGKIFMAKCGISFSLIPLYLIVFSKKDWVALFAIWATLFVAIFGFLR